VNELPFAVDRCPCVKKLPNLEGSTDVTANPKRCRACVFGDRFTGLERPVRDPSLGLAQRDRAQGLPACEEASATSAPPQHHRRAGIPAQLAYTHSSVMCTIPQACDFLGQYCGVATAHRLREARWMQHGQLV
jgi:hypothetical protein